MSTSLTTSEQLIWKKIKAAKNGAMTQAQLESGLPGMRVKEAQSSISSLIGMKLLVTSTLKDGTTLFKAAEPDAAVKKNTLTDEQKIVLHVITQAGNKGLNSKQIRAQVPSTIIPNALRKALEILEKNEHVKTFRSVNAPTTILYCAFHFEPPVEITGGVWYDDSKEYDHTLVEAISLFLLKYVQSKTYPQIAKMPPSHLALVPNPIFPVGRTKNLPSPAQLLKVLTLSEITPAKMRIKNIMEIMRKLELDGLIEVVKPLDGVAVQESDGDSDDEEPMPKKRKVESDDDMDSEEKERKEEKEKEKARERAKAKRKKEKERERKREKERAKEKKRRKKEKEREKEKEKEKRRKERDKKRKKKRIESDDNASEEEDELRTIDEVRRSDKKSKSKSSKSKRRRRGSDDSSDVSSSGDDSDSNSDSDSDSEASVSATLSDSSVDSDDIDSRRLTSKPSANNFSSAHTTLAPAGLQDLSDTAVVFRALSRMSAPLGQTEISCGKCPAFNFCEEDGPVNPTGCEYLDDWLSGQKGGWENRPSDAGGRGVGSKGKKKMKEDINEEEEEEEEYEEDVEMAVDQ